jgi:hypothetical protein
MNTSVLNDSAAMDATQLAIAARKAHEQKRIKECLGLIQQLLLCDPGNIEAQALRAAVYADVEQDLSDARVLLTDSESRPDGHKYRKAAEIILLKILYLDPTHSEARTLLATAKGTTEPVQSTPVVVEGPKLKPAVVEELGFTALPTRVANSSAPKGSGIIGKLPVLVAGFILLAGGGLFLSRTRSSISAAPVDSASNGSAYAAAPSSGASSNFAAARNETIPDTALATPAAASAAEAGIALAAAGPIVPVVAAPGLLAISSSVAAEIYMGGKLLGETPATLQLPAGNHTIEYRHGDLKTTVTHDIKSRETVNALVQFEVTVQINARPWAQVFLEGAARKPLGQTPVSSVRVPLGSVLTFENPNFQSKSYQVTEKDSSIQVIFP